MRRSLLIFVPLAAGLVLAAEPNSQDPKTRDLSAMFYTDTLPVKKAVVTSTSGKAPDTRTPPRTGGRQSNPPAGDTPPTAMERRIGIKAHILLHDSSCSVQEVSPNRIFKSGEQIRLQLESNVDGYLYVLQKGSSGGESVLFPDSRINGGVNHVQRGVVYSVPGAQWFGFNDQPGEEHLLIIASRTPLDWLPNTAQPGPRPQVGLMMAENNLRHTVQSRDLVLFEEDAPQVGELPRVPQSMIVVNTSDTQNETAYLELTLKHR